MFRSTLVRRVGTLLLLGAATLPQLAVAQDVTIPHAQGETTLTAAPKKAAVFDMASLDILNALGVDAVAGVPKSTEGPANFPAHIAHYGDADYAAVGTLFEPDEAALRELGPDLIIVGGRSRNAFEAVSAIAPSIDMSGSGTDIVATTIGNTTTLGRVFGAEDRATQKIEAFNAALADLREQGASAGTGLVLFAAGQGVSAHAPGARFGTVYDFVGIDSVMAPADPAAAGPRPQPGSPEAEAARQRQQEELAAALEAGPDWIFALDRNAATSNEPSTLQDRLAENEQVTATAAWQNGQVIYLDPKTWYLVGTGIDALTASAQDISATLSAAK